MESNQKSEAEIDISLIKDLDFAPRCQMHFGKERCEEEATYHGVWSCGHSWLYCEPHLHLCIQRSNAGTVMCVEHQVPKGENKIIRADRI